MRKIHVDASGSYDILVENGLLEQAGKRIRDLGDIRHVMIVSDDRVFPLYGERLSAGLQSEGIRVSRFVFPHGEQSKCMAVYEQLMEYLCTCGLTRTDAIAALGGGVAGDLAGFAAATYQRGIRFIQIPTTLLAAVDSSVGGKTAVNLSGGKNQAGAFYQPSLVLCDPETLETLPEEEYRNGCAEVIKYGMIGNRDFFFRLGQKPVREWVDEVIEICVSMKRDVVMRDEFDTGDRMLLNFGHTLGHGVEKLSGYTIPHGTAVAMGMAEITAGAQEQGICPEGTAEQLNALLALYDLPTVCPYPAADIARAAGSDKKKSGDVIRIIIPEEIGRCVIKAIPADSLICWTRKDSL